MLKILITPLLFLFLGLSFCKAQAGDPEKIIKYSKKKERLDTYLDEQKWKKVAIEKDDDDDMFYLYRKKSYGGGSLYLAVYPSEFLHYQKYEFEKHPYSMVMTYDDFIHCPLGKTKEIESISSEYTHFKSVIIEDPHNIQNENRFFGIIPVEMVKTTLAIENSMSKIDAHHDKIKEADATIRAQKTK